MAVSYLEYQLHGEYVHNWLVAGPQATPVTDLSSYAAEDLRPAVARDHYRRFSAIDRPPVERDSFQVGDTELTWSYYRCQDDHFVDLSTFYHTCHLLRSWAYTQVVAPSAQEVTMTLTTNGPADVWLNRKHVHRHEGFAQQDPQSVSFGAEMQDGVNEILVRFEAVAIRECPYVMALRIVGLAPHDGGVKLPVPHENVPRRQKLERIYQEAYIQRPILVSGENEILCWDDEIDETGTLDFWVQDSREHVQVVGTWETRPGECLELGGRQRLLKEGPHRVALLPPAYVIERYDIRYQEYLPFHVFQHAYSTGYYGTYEERRTEALRDAAEREGTLYGASAAARTAATLTSSACWASCTAT
jgi:hypothetical protein